ncbi:shikimate transporter [Aliidongia dinghuensis]|uniref:Shikimate transporter n=1 Tax=Aliidongia dinghuensis TaxID=1867774 RepID=A0A8J3E3P9_9PROT|nr:MFS transporter [Aliidongia dinghuensis]GGF17949.1 shikimate transporter [Aliidongia dinghuensis]
MAHTNGPHTIRRGSTQPKRSLIPIMLAAAVGSALEWYDFFVYGTAAALVFGDLFFPKFEPSMGMLLSFTTFGVGFVARPFGGILFGYLGDRWGRKPVLVTTILLVGGGTFLIGLLPTYAEIGLWAPVLLAGLRLVQGLGAGAEYGGAVILAVEYAPETRRGFFGSFAPMGVTVGNLLAAGVFGLVSLLPKDQVMSWGWRVPFLISLALVLVGVLIRLRVQETPVFTEAVKRRPRIAIPALAALSRHPRNFAVVVGARLAENGLGYLFPVFGLSYIINTLHLPRNTALLGVFTGNFVEIAGILFFGYLSDKVGRRPVYMGGALFSALFAFPFFALVNTGNTALIVIAFALIMGIGGGAMFGPQAAYFAELFGPRLRFSGFAFARELGSILAGGPAPAVASLLVLWMDGAPWGVALYVIALSVITAAAVWWGPETHTSDIRADYDPANEAADGAVTAPVPIRTIG